MNPLPWSHSALSDFKNCPKQYFHKRIAKDVTDPPNDAGLWGDYVHKQFEAYLKGRITELPSDVRMYTEYLEQIKAKPGTMLVECKYAITKAIEPCAFFAPDVWCRAILDVIHIDGQRADVLDHKTGKRKFDTRQLKLSALMVFAHHPEVQVIRTAYHWLKEKESDYEVYVRSGEAELWQEFLPDLRAYKQAAKTMVFMPRPSGLCNGWCPVTACEFWKPKRGR